MSDDIPSDKRETYGEIDVQLEGDVGIQRPSDNRDDPNPGFDQGVLSFTFKVAKDRSTHITSD